MASSPGSLPVPLPADAAPGCYVHIPFCRYICPYCDFNVYAGQSDLIPAYVEGLERELALLAAADRYAGEVATVFIGGGTPSLLDPSQIGRIVETIHRTLGIASGAEITMESNPDNLDENYCRGLIGAGINRLSIGVQSMQQPGLKVLGRLHGAEGAERAFRAARSAGFNNISLDFIYGWPGQTREQLTSDIDTLLEWEIEHVSLYALIVEQGTPMSTAVRRGQLHPVDDDTVAAYYDYAVERLANAGWEHYEISNWARTPEHRSIHNQIYWQNGHYYGVGAGAHSYLGDIRASNIRLPVRYVEAVSNGTIPIATSEMIGSALEMGETMMLGLRLLQDGVSASDFQRRHGIALSERYGALIDRFIEMGLLVAEGGRIRLSPSGAMVSNSVLAEFLP
ncbi:MAG: radical SAM family heme chaperone HemW [Thermomicrobiales bacterium]